jgi:RNA methyltransferase, TrmH family
VKTVEITSRQNPRFKSLAKLISSARDLRAEGLCVLEGEHLISQFVASGLPLETLIVTSDFAHKNAFMANEVLQIPVAHIGAFSELISPQNVIALAKIPQNPPIPAAQLVPFSVLILEKIQDPSNVGALLRTAAAMGVREAWLSEGCAYAWSQKTLRASQGAQCNLVVRENIELLSELAKFNGEICVTTLAESTPLSNAKLSAARIAFVMGNEGEGVSEAVLKLASTRVRIPMHAGVESLNVGAAAAIVLYEWQRQITVKLGK